MTCSLCRLEPAESFCVCSSLPTFCPPCRALHEAKPGFHFALPLEGRAYVTRENQSQYMAWLLCLANSQAKLSENMQLMDQCREDVEAVFGHIQAEMDRVKVQVVQTLEEMKSALGYHIAQAINETSVCAYLGSYQPSSYLASMIWTHSCQQSSEPIYAFAYQLEPNVKAIEECLGLSFRTFVPDLQYFNYGSSAKTEDLIPQLATNENRCKDGEAENRELRSNAEKEIASVRSIVEIKSQIDEIQSEILRTEEDIARRREELKRQAQDLIQSINSGEAKEHISS